MKLAAALLFAPLLALVATATAAPDVTTQRKADALFDAGQASYQQGEYQRAIEQFKQAYALVHDPVYLFNIAQSYRKVGDCEGAHEYYKKFLEEAPAAENKEKVEQWVRELQPCVDERDAERKEAARRAAEEAERKRMTLPPPPPPPAQTEVDHGQGYRIAGYALIGIGVVGVAAGISYGIKSRDLKDDVAERCSLPNMCQWDSAEIQSLHNDGQSANTRAFIGYIGGGAAVLTGVTLYFIGRSRVESVWVTPAQGGATVTAQLQF